MSPDSTCDAAPIRCELLGAAQRERIERVGRIGRAFGRKNSASGDVEIGKLVALALYRPERTSPLEDPRRLADMPATRTVLFSCDEAQIVSRIAYCRRGGSNQNPVPQRRQNRAR